MAELLVAKRPGVGDEQGVGLELLAVADVGEDVQVMTLFIRTAEKSFEKHEFGDFRFVPMLKEKSNNR